MLISIIVPVHNSERFIRKCVDSILQQSFIDFELIAINDGSTDNSLSILNEYANLDSRVKVFSFENAGVSIARQRGVNLATGDYIVFVDSDDTISPELLTNIYNATVTYDLPDIIRYRAYLVNDNPKKNHERFNTSHAFENAPIPGIDAIKLWATSGKKYALYWLYAFKRNIFEGITFPKNLHCYEDVALIPILIAKAKKVVAINYVGYNYTYNNDSSITNKNTLEAINSRVLDFINACDYLTYHFAMLEDVTYDDIHFMFEDYSRRLSAFYNSIDNPELRFMLGSRFDIK